MKLPQNIEAEQALLSALLIDNNNFEDIEDLSPDAFYKTAHQKIYKQMLILREKQEPVDLVTLAKELKKTKNLKSVGGAAYLATIADNAPVAINAKYYAKIIQNCSVARDMILTALKIANAGYAAYDIEQYISESQSQILNIQTTTSQDIFFNMQELTANALNRIEKAQTENKPAGYRLGLPTLDTMIQVIGSKLILIAGRPGMGKTSLALSIAKKFAQENTKVGFLSIEMDKEALIDKLLGHESDISPLRFYNPYTLSSDEIDHIMDSADKLADLPILIDDSECSIQDVERKCRKMKKAGCKVIFIDQLSKIKGERRKTKFENYTDNCSAIALLKKELRIPIFLLCQLNREVEKAADKHPDLMHLKQTGMLEEDADMVFFIYRPGYYDKSINPAETEIILAKNRQGACGVEKNVVFNARRAMFELN